MALFVFANKSNSIDHLKQCEHLACPVPNTKLVTSVSISIGAIVVGMFHLFSQVLASLILFNCSSKLLFAVSSSNSSQQVTQLSQLARASEKVFINSHYRTKGICCENNYHCKCV